MKKLRIIILGVFFVLAVVIGGAVVRTAPTLDADATVSMDNCAAVETSQPDGHEDTPPQPLRDEVAFKAFQELVSQFEN